MTERMGYWVDLDDAYWTMDPTYVESVWWSLKQIFDKGLLVEDHRVTPYCPRCGTGAVRPRGRPRATRPSSTPRSTSGSRSPPARWPARRRPAGLDDDAVDAGVQHRGRGATPTSTTSSRAPTARARSWWPSRCWPRCSARTREVLGRLRRARAGALALPAAVRPGRRSPRRALSWCSPTTSPPRTAPAWCTRPPRSAPTTWRPARAYGLPVVNPVGAGRPLRGRTSRWSAGCSSRTPTTPLVGRPARARAAVPAAAVRAQLPALLALPHRRCCTTRCRPGTSAPPRSRTELLARERAHQLVPDDDQARPVRRLAEQQRRLGAVPRPLLGHPAADLALRRTSHVTCVGSLAELGSLAGQDLSDAGPAPAVRRRRRRSPARPAARPARRVPQVIDAWFDSGSMPFAQWGAPAPQRRASSSGATRPQFICEAIDQTRGWFYSLMAVGTAGVRTVVVRDRALPRAHPGRGRPQDEQAPGQHPRADRR